MENISSHIRGISWGKGLSIAQVAAYDTGLSIDDYLTGQRYYQYRDDVDWFEINLPSDAAPELQNLQNIVTEINRAEKRKNARTAKEVVSSYHVKLSPSDRINITRRCISKVYVSRGICAIWAIHDKGTGNPHVHILLTTRPVGGGGFCGKKNPAWDKKELVLEWREMWAKEQSLALAKKGLNIELSHEAYYVQGKYDEEKTKTIHLGPKVKALFEREGIITDRMAEHLAIMEARKAKERGIEAQKSREQEREFERTR